MKRFLVKKNFLLFVCILFFLIAWNREINLLYGMFALISATIIISHIYPRYSLRAVSVTRTLPSTAFEGDTISLDVNIINRAATSRHMIEVLDSVPAAEPGMRTPMTFIAKLRGRKDRAYSFKVTCYKRGEYSIGPLTLTSSYPLGITSAEKSFSGEIQPLLVYPEMFDVSCFPFVSGSSFPASGQKAVSRAGGSEDFFGTREYREGDSLRYIHWPSTARHGELIVKEFEIRASSEVTFLIDLHRNSDIGTEKESTLEYAVKIAASLSKYAMQRGHSFQCIGYGMRPHIVTYGKGESHLASVLETLARVRPDGSVPYSRAIRDTAEFLKDGSTLVLIFSITEQNLDEYLYSMALLRARRIRTVCVFLNGQGFLEGNDSSGHENSPLIQEFLAAGAPVYLINKGDDLSEVFSI